MKKQTQRNINLFKVTRAEVESWDSNPGQIPHTPQIKRMENYIFLKNNLLLPLHTLHERKYICQLVYIYFFGNTHNLHICGEFMVNSHYNQDVNFFTGLK